MDREAWRAAVHGVAKSRTWLSNWTELNWTDDREIPPQAYGNGQTYNTEHQTGEVDSSLLVTSPHILGEGKDIIGCAGLHYAWNLEWSEPPGPVRGKLSSPERVRRPWFPQEAANGLFQ